MAGDREENEERSAQRERRGNARGCGGEPQGEVGSLRPLMQSEEERKKEESLDEVGQAWRCKQVICQQHVVNTTTNQQTHSWPVG